MTPYLINTTWMDLDHVLAIEEGLDINSYTNSTINGIVTMAFRSEPLVIKVGYFKTRTNDFGRQEVFVPSEVIAKWNQFIQAWKDRDKIQSTTFNRFTPIP